MKIFFDLEMGDKNLEWTKLMRLKVDLSICEISKCEKLE